MSVPPMTDVWTVQGNAEDLTGWLLGGVFASFESACEHAEQWASDKPGLETYVYRRTLDAPRAKHDDDIVPVFRVPPALEQTR